MITNKIFLFEYDVPLDLDRMQNYEAGIWFWKMTPGLVIVTDDHAQTGYYTWNNDKKYNIQSFRYEDLSYSKVDSLADCRVTDNSFFYDEITTNLYIHREEFEPILTNNMVVGVAVGYTQKTNTNNYYLDSYYEPRVKSLFSFKKSIDPLFYGLLKYQSGDITLANEDGEFDDWRSRNLFRMASRILEGEVGFTYDQFKIIFSAYIENDKSSWTDLKVTLQDPRKGLTQGVATNLLSDTEYIDLNPDNNDTAKPVAYGKIKSGSAYCLNELEGGTPSTYTFLFADTEFRSVTSIQEVRVDGVVKTVIGSDLAAGTFDLTNSDVGGNFDEVKIDFTMPISNGVEILKDLMFRYDNKPFLDSFFDTAEIALAVTASRNTSLYIEESSFKLAEAIESVSNDCDIRFFIKNNGLYTARIYDENRTPDWTISKDDWIGEPKITNNGNQYLTSVRIGYNHNLEDDTRLYHENLDYRDTTFDIYKQYKTDTFDTELTTLSDAIDKSETIMNISKEIGDIVERTTNWNYAEVEPTDFVIANPTDRVSSLIDTFGIYEVMNVTRDPATVNVKLSLRYVKSYTPPVVTVGALVDELDNYFTDETGNNLIEETVT